MVLGVDLGGTNIRVGLVDNEMLVSKITGDSPSAMTLEESKVYIISKICEAFILNKNIKGIGIGVPSVVDVDEGIVYNVANIPSWKEVHLKRLLENEFHVPVAVNNDSNCFVLGEQIFGKGRNFKNVVGITLGTGVGAGLIINDKLYCGSNTSAGEIGTIPYLDKVYEEYCGSNFFIEMKTTGKKVYEGAIAGDTQALNCWKSYGKHLGNLLQTALFAYDPDAIILGGGISKAYPFFESAMRETLKAFPYPQIVDRLTIDISSNPDIAILGASALLNS